MVVDRSNVDHIMRGLQSTEGVRLHNHRKKLRQRFDIIKKLGQGTYGKVQLGINKETGQEVAIKTIKKCKIETEADLVRIRREIQIMSSVRHPNIIHIYEVFENREKIVLVMEYAAGGELYDYLSQRKVLEETEARRIFRQISTAIYYCHKHKICHRDLKLENILLDEHGNAKIADFGLSNVFDGQRLLSTYCGSPLYASPEIVKGTPYHGPEVDCWSLGVLLYTLVYGAMPFDGSNFKRLVKQISQGNYFEPKKPSSASPLIREMLTVNSPDRATIEQICSHWWVNQGFNVSCLDIAEDLANQTPVRLDLLLSLAPPPENTEKIVVTDDQNAVPQEAPPRSLSVGSFMELDANAEERVRSFVAREVPSENANEKTMKRKLEPVPSKSFSGARKKERTKPEMEEKEEEPEIIKSEPSAKKPETNNGEMDVDTESNKSSEKLKNQEISAKVESQPLEKTEESQVPLIEKENSEQSEMAKKEVDKPTDAVSKDKPTRKSIKVVKKKVTEKKDLEPEKKEEKEATDAKEMVKKQKTDSPALNDEPRKEKSQEKEEVGKEIKKDGTTRKSIGKIAKQPEREEKEKTPRSEESPTKPTERRKSKIFETAEKFMTNDQKGSPTQDKPKKVYIPGVKVSDFAKAFERRSSVPSTPPLKSSPSKKTIIKESGNLDKKSDERKSPEKKSKSPEKKKDDNSSQLHKTVQEPKEEINKEKEISKEEAKEKSPESKAEEEHKPTPVNDEKLKKLKDSARNIIANALVEDERKKIKKQILKPPVPRTKTEDLDARKKSLTLQIGKETATVQVHTPENTKFLFEPEGDTTTNENKENIDKPKEKKTAKLEITLKSNTLPRRTSKAEVRLASPQVQKDIGNFRTEVEHRVGDPSHVYSTQRSEVAFPVSAAQKPIRSMSLEPEGRTSNWQTRERIIPIQVEGGRQKEESEARDRVKELDRPHEGRQKLPYQRTLSLRSNSLSRQSTQDSDTENTMPTTGEPIKKSPREFIIPIAVEGGGYVTPRATSLEPSESMSSKRSHRPFSRKFSLWSDNGSEDESPFSTLQRHSSREVDEPFRLHRLRSSRPTRSSVEKADSASGSEEEEDDDGFELLTAENLFSTLLSRVRSLTQRLNVEDGMRPGFPSSRLLSNHFGPSERLFSNFHQPLTRLSERSEFGRSLSRDMENGSNRWSRTDIRNSDSNRSVPRGSSKSRRSDSDTESMSESSAAASNSRKQKKEEEKKEKKSRSHSRTRSGPVGAKENEEITEYVPTFDGNRSLYVPSRMWTAKAYEKRNSEGDVVPQSHRSGIPKLLRPTSLLLERTGRDSEEREYPEEPKEKDFYDILAEKYGITNVMRYDLPRERRTSSDRMRFLTENRRSYVLEKEPQPEPNKEKNESEKDTLPQSKPKKEESSSEKYKAPSEKLAAVLSRLERRPSVKKESNPVEKKTENDPMNLSPAAMELYEKTLAEYKKLKKSGENEKQLTPEPSKDSGKSKIPKKLATRHQSDMTLKEFEKIQGTREPEKESSTPERSVLSKYFRYNKEEPAGNKEEVAKESSKEEDKVMEKEEVKKGENRNNKNKFITSLEKKLEKLRTSSEKKYVDRAIRSLRESSVGPKDVSSENVLIKRAVSLSDCPSYKCGQPGKIQSTVNSVLGMFKKFENTEEKRKENPEPEKEVKSKIPVFKKTEIAPKVEPPIIRKPEPLQIPTFTRRPSYFTGNGFSFYNSISPGLDDSPTFLSPDSESYDSWSNCSDLGTVDDVLLHGRNYSKYGNADDVSKESVSDRIRRKSFYTRFNERKKPRRSSLLAMKTNYDTKEGDRTTEARPSYYRSVSSGDEYTKKSYEEGRPRPFYKTTESPSSRNNSFDWTRNSYLRSTSQSPSNYSSLTLPRNFTALDRGYRASSLYGSRSPDTERPLSPVRPFSPVRPYSPRPASPFAYSRCHSPNNFD